MEDVHQVRNGEGGMELRTLSGCATLQHTDGPQPGIAPNTAVQESVEAS